MRRALLLGTAALLTAAELPAQSITPSSPLVLNLDYARFRNDDQSGYLEVYYGFYPTLITYEYEDGKYRGGIELRTQLIREETGEVLVDRQSPLRIAESDTSGVWYRYPFITQAGFAVPFGRYLLNVIAYDLRAPARRDSVRLPLEIEPFSSEMAMSDLELCKSIKASEDETDLFYKNTLEVVPNPSLVFGIATSPVLFHYCELYNVSPGQTVTVKTVLTDDNGRVVREKTKTRTFASTSAVEVGTTPLTSYPSGKYYLRCEVTGEDSTEIARSEKWFFIYSPHLKDVPIPSVTELASELERRSSEQLVEEFRLARYVATEEEIQMFLNIQSDLGRREFLAVFWAKVARGRQEKPPILRAEYLRRVELANEKFTSFGKEGWLTDRGRVYILYSDPDEIERYPGLTDSKAYQIWRYYSIESGVEFVFVDRSGYGDYELVHSTKRGELQDELWERFLR